MEKNSCLFFIYLFFLISGCTVIFSTRSYP
uniref:Uncharacterized protein n=1 Tax=Anguilla anguilla TaxID=7936 RepID=A0A0E9UIA5_ANGAN